MRNTISFDFCENYITSNISDDVSDNTVKRATILKIIKLIIADELTDKQRHLFNMYYFNKMSMEAIAQEVGVNKSTVSRTIARGLKRINDRVKYYKLR